LIELSVHSGTTRLFNYNLYSSQGYGWIMLEKLVPGNYSIIAKVNWEEVEVKDFTISINSEDTINISNILGERESTSLKRTEDIKTSLISNL
jgi:hypothetical protein